LFLELHKGHHEGFLEELTNNSARSGTNETPEQKYRRIFGAGKIMTEPIFYSGSGAYDFQYLDFAVVKYRDDEAWISQHMGIAIPEMATIARELKRLHEQKYNALRTLPRGNFSVLCKAALAVFCFEEKDLQHFGAAAVKGFVSAFSLVPGKVNAKLRLPGQYNQLQSSPVVQLPDGRYFVPICFNLSEAIYESPFYWMNTDSSYASEALRHRGQFAENATANLLRSVFGTSNVYTNVEVRKTKGRNITDVDVLAICGQQSCHCPSEVETTDGVSEAQ